MGKRTLELACIVFALALAPLPLLARPAIECLERSNYADATLKMGSSSEVLQFAERKRDICVDLALRETGRGYRLSAQCIGNTEEIADASFWIARGKPQKNYPSWLAAVQSCVDGLSAEELVRRNSDLSSRFRALKEQEENWARAAAAPVQLKTGQEASSKRPRDCIGDVDIDFQDHFLQRALTTTDLTAFVEKNKREYCRSLIVKEFNRGKSGVALNCVVTSNALLSSLSETFNSKIDQSPWPLLIQECTHSLTAEEIIAINRPAAARYAILMSKETQATQTKARREATIDAAQQIAKDFSIKGLGLSSTKADLNRIAAGIPTFWACQSDSRSFKTDVCVANLESKACYDVMVGNEIAGYLRRKKCDTSMAELEKLPLEVRNIATVGGVRVTQIQVSFYDGKVIDVTFFLKELDATLKDGLTQKYGQPTIDDGPQAASWYAKDSMLSWKSEALSVRNTNLWGLRNRQTEEHLRNAQVEQKGKERSRQDANKKDF